MRAPLRKVERYINASASGGGQTLQVLECGHMYASPANPTEERRCRKCKAEQEYRDRKAKRAAS